MSTQQSLWEFGQQVHYGCQHHMPEYQLSLHEHSGIIVGQTEKGLLMSLLQLAHLAVSHGWQVVLFDPQTTEDGVATFVSTVQAAGCPKVYPFKGQTRQETLSSIRSLNKMLVDPTSTAYIGVNVWSQPIEARVFARLLLAHIMMSIGMAFDSRMLLLLKHPELLFEPEQTLPLFAALEQTQGSVFAAVRSMADFGSLGAAHAQNARTVIAHRSTPSPDLISCVGASDRPFFDRRVRALPDDECFVLHAGECTHVRVKAVASEEEEFDEDDEAFLAAIFGSGKRSACDKAHLRRAKALLGYEDLQC